MNPMNPISSKIFSAMLCVVMLLTCLAGGVIAKNTDCALHSGPDGTTRPDSYDEMMKETGESGIKENGSGRPEMRWSFSLNDSDITRTKRFKIDLNKTLLDTRDRRDEHDTAPMRIAPGMYGYFPIKVRNDSTCDAKYTIKVVADEIQGKLPVVYNFRGKGGNSMIHTYVPEADIPDNPDTGPGDKDNIQVISVIHDTIDENTTQYYFFEWIWLYEQPDVIPGDKVDTHIGITHNNHIPSSIITIEVDVEEIEDIKD